MQRLKAKKSQVEEIPFKRLELKNSKKVIVNLTGCGLTFCQGKIHFTLVQIFGIDSRACWFKINCWSSLDIEVFRRLFKYASSCFEILRLLWTFSFLKRDLTTISGIYYAMSRSAYSSGSDKPSGLIMICQKIVSRFLIIRINSRTYSYRTVSEYRTRVATRLYQWGTFSRETEGRFRLPLKHLILELQNKFVTQAKLNKHRQLSLYTHCSGTIWWFSNDRSKIERS